MNKSVFKLLVLVLIPIFFFCCDHGIPPNGEEDTPLVFSSMQADRDTIFTGDTTLIRAIASGYKITFHWHVEKGDLLGSGDEVTFLATPCSIGNNIVNCTIRDGNANEITKNVTITVF